ncbi:SepM family pheromone-processing serine protease [Heyndrickxia ginsengihumi]|uniref:endopeptidase La n=1 Tax=Heyndrickxia ginsengihumi TaxID=363870 RepID=A0A6M0P3X6_9BACI|nr:SepM family pheromone-processing serine protease [Heyndrickxia ginsengihumi]MBE6183679.1 PDZ domain-containing protein [Bacillus sp. (in: firmicutes)]MCM3022389.1 PDZ domain-containing protein [Heyndrickxia ginsengihumi]NEY18669.1 PDZ domain-containing protein [Heyndrickxia ginsengihumi]
MKFRKNRLRILICIVIILAAISFIRLPYYIEMPGSALQLAPIIKVKGGYHEKGQLMLTTVRMARATPYLYVWAKLHKHDDIVPLDEVRDKNQTEEEYNVYQLYLMENSKHNAIEVAFSNAHKPYKSHYKGIYVLDVYDDMPASKVLKVGDRVTKVDHHSFQSSKQFMNYVGKKKLGDSVAITYIHDHKEKTASVKLARFKENKDKVGIGIGLVDDRTLTSNPSVKMNTENIGGPSAGLMFSLEIYNQLTKQDITKGYKIAGTGEIATNGEVGRIGGIDKKVIAASKAGAEIFFAPNDHITPEMKKTDPHIKTNYQEALQAAKDIHTKMKIVPVKTFNDALSYLNQLKAKE